MPALRPARRGSGGVANELANTAFFGRTFEEALALVIEARDYVAGRLAFDRETVGIAEQLVCDCETLRLTSRLTHVMAWLLIQRAIHAGGGQDLSSGDLIALQAGVYRYVEVVDLASKLVDRVTQSAKTITQGNGG